MKRLASLVAVLPLLLPPLLPSSAHAQGTYPNKPVRVIVGYQAGGPTDITARLVAEKMAQSMGQPFVIENRPGAGSNIATEAVSTAPADGYTLLYAAVSIVSNGFTYKDLRWNVDKNFEPISMVMSAPGVLAVAPNSEPKNLNELLAQAKQRPGKLTYASTGAGGTQHLAGELLKVRAGVDLVHVPYKGSAGVLTDLMSGQVSMAFITSLGAMEFLTTGKVRPIAVAAMKRLPQLPDVPTMAEAGLPDFVSDSWNGLFVPKGTPPEIIAKLSAEVRKAVSAPDVREKLESQGAILVGDTPAEFKARIQSEADRFQALLKVVKITVE